MFLPGQSGNPNGRKPGTGKRQTISQALQNYLDGKKNGERRLEIAIERLFENDLKTFFAYAYGKPLETQMNLTPEDTQNEIEIAVARVLAKRNDIPVASVRH